MKKLWILVDNIDPDEIELKKFINDDDIEYEIIDVDALSKRKDQFTQEIIDNDTKLVKKPNFEAKLLQSSSDRIPTRLIIPDSFARHEPWNKEYTILHELGHYYSSEDEKIISYYSILESKRLYSEMYNVPLEVAAEKIVKDKKYDLFVTHCLEVYAKYYQQIKELVENGQLNSRNIAENFSAVFAIRVFRFAAILYATLVGDKHFKELREKLDNTVALLNNLGEYSRSLASKIDAIVEASDLQSNEIDDYLAIAGEVSLLGK